MINSLETYREAGKRCGIARREHDEARAQEVYPPLIAHYQRWIDHYANRIEYEKAMLDEGGGLVADQVAFEVGGRVLVRGEWVTILKINKRGGVVTSLDTNRQYCSRVTPEKVKEYKAPEKEFSEQLQAKFKEREKFYNYPGENFCHLTRKQWADIYRDYKGSEIISGEGVGPHRVRVTMGGSARQYGYKAPEGGSTWDRVKVYITDMKREDPPAIQTESEAPAIPPPEDTRTRRPYQPAAVPEDIERMRAALKEGVQTVTAPQLFPTPPELAARMVEIAEIEPTHKVLEPSAGTGNIIKAIGSGPDITAVEINLGLVGLLARVGVSGVHIVQGDFLEQNGELGKFDRILMNPPFENGADIKHINHALAMLEDSGRLVALCANGPRQREAFLNSGVADLWEELPAGTFKEQGAGVNVALLVINN